MTPRRYFLGIAGSDIVASSEPHATSAKAQVVADAQNKAQAELTTSRVEVITEREHDRRLGVAAAIPDEIAVQGLDENGRLATIIVQSDPQV